MNPEVFGMTGNVNWAAGLYAASLVSTIWTATHTGNGTSYKFSTAQNTIDNDARIPIIYGTRKWAGGLETYFQANSSASKITKDIVLCEGEIKGIQGVTANCIPIGVTTLFEIENIAYSDATLHVYETDDPTGNDKAMVLYANGSSTTITLQDQTDIDDDSSNDYCCSTLKLQQHIEKLGNGWRVINNCGADVSPEDVYEVSTTSCYKSPVAITYKGETKSSYTAYTGSASQSPPSNYATTGSYKNTAWLRASLKATSTLSFSNPNMCAVVKGKLVYDTRTGKTAYSENPAMCLRDYMLNKRYGMGRWITEDMLDADSFEEVADYCDEGVTYEDAYGVTVTEPRYTLNIIIAQKRKHIEDIQDFLAVFGGFLVFNGDKIGLRVEKQESISYTFTDQDNSNIIKDSVKYEYASLANTPNRYVIHYYDPAQDWAAVPVFVDDYADQYSRGNVIRKEVTLNGCTSQGQALRLGRMYKAINRLCAVTLTFSTGTMAMHLQPGDIISWTHRIVSGEPFRITRIVENKGKWTITAQQYNSSIYDDQLGSKITVANYVTVPNPLTDTVPNCSDIGSSQTYYLQKDGTAVSTLTVDYTLPSYQFLDCIMIYYSIDEGSTWITAGQTTDNSFTISNVLVGDTYYIKLVTKNTMQRYSSGITSDGILITGKDDNPSDITDFVVAQKGDYFVVSGDTPTDLDFNSIEIRYGSTSWASATYLANITSFPAYVSNSGVDDGSVVFRAKAIDNGGNYSTNDAEYVVTVSGINDYKNIVLSRDDVTLKDGTLTNIVRNTEGNLISTSSIEYGDFKTYADLPIETYSEGVQTFTFLSPVIDTYKVGKTGINFIFDYSIYDEEPLYGSFPDRTYGDYPLDAYGQITIENTIAITIRFSDDNETWGDWQTYLAGEYSFRYIQYKLVATYESQTARAIVTKLLQYYDVPDLTFSKTLAVPATGLDVVFADYDVDFYATPTEVTPTVIGGSGNVFPDITNLTASGLHIDCYDRTGTQVSGTVLLVCKGY